MAMADFPVADEEAALVLSSSDPLYYVQSPSAASPSTNIHLFSPSLYSSSSSCGSNINSLVEDKKQAIMEQTRGGGITGLMDKLLLPHQSRSFCSLAFHLGWRMAVSLSIALLVFFLATNPPEPQLSVKNAEVGHFRLGEGLDETGVATELISCNCSVEMEVDNNSNFFGLHVHPPLLELMFGPLTFASAKSQAFYVESASSSLRRLFIGVRNRPMYGAGRNIQDLLQSGRGLSLTIRIRTPTAYRVVWDLIKIERLYLHDCFVFLQAMHDVKYYANMYSSGCFNS